jgi:hypothetical protein
MGGVTGEASAARSPWRVFVVLAIAVFVAILDLFLVNIAFPDIRRSFPSASLASCACRAWPMGAAITLPQTWEVSRERPASS